MASDSRDLSAATPAESQPVAEQQPVEATTDDNRPVKVDEETAAQAVGRDPELLELESRHGRFVWPITVFFIIYYMALNVLAGSAPGLMGRKVFGSFTFGYLFALSQFLMAFIVAWAYTRFARTRIDPLAADLRKKLHARRIKEVGG